MKKQQQTLFSDAGRQPRRGLLWFLFLVYLAAMTWIILFKFSISLDELPDIRKINFVPFGEMVIVNGQPDFSEVIMNGVIFLPFGIYLSALFPGGPFWKKFFAFAGVSLAYEICQYIFSIGTSDITDLMFNCLGGCVGVLVFAVIRLVAGSHRKAVIFTTVAAAVCTALTAALLAVLVIFNL